MLNARRIDKLSSPHLLNTEKIHLVASEFGYLLNTLKRLFWFSGTIPRLFGAMFKTPLAVHSSETNHLLDLRYARTLEFSRYDVESCIFSTCHRFDCREPLLRCLAASSVTSLSTSSCDSIAWFAGLSTPTARYPPSSLSNCRGVTGPGLPIGIRRGLSGPSSCTGVDERAAAETISLW